MAATDAPAGDGSDNDFGHTAHEDVYVEDREAWDAIFADVAAAALGVLVAARAEGLGAFARQDDDADAGAVACMTQRAVEFYERSRAEGVAHVRASDGDASDARGRDVVADVGQRHVGEGDGRPGGRVGVEGRRFLGNDVGVTEGQCGDHGFGSTDERRLASAEGRGRAWTIEVKRGSADIVERQISQMLLVRKLSLDLSYWQSIIHTVNNLS